MRVTVFGAFLGPSAGLAAVWLQGRKRLNLVYSRAATGSSFDRPALHTASAQTDSRTLSLVETWDVWKPMAKLGAAFMLGGLATAATLLLVRSRISQELGLDAAGHFAAAWGITMTYVGFPAWCDGGRLLPSPDRDYPRQGCGRPAHE